MSSIMENNKHAKTTLVEERRNPEPSVRIKKRDDLLLVQLDFEKRTLRVVQERTIHLSKMGWSEGRNRFMLIEEVIYLMELGSAAVVTGPKSELLSLNQLYALLPHFGVTFFQFCAFRSLIRAAYRVKRAPPEHRKLFHYNVYVNSIGDIHFEESAKNKFLKFHLFAGSPAEKPSEELHEFASRSETPVFITSGQSSCVRFAQLLQPDSNGFWLDPEVLV